MKATPIVKSLGKFMVFSVGVRKVQGRFEAARLPRRRRYEALHSAQPMSVPTWYRLPPMPVIARPIV